MNDEEKQSKYNLAARLISEQNFLAAIIAGAVGSLLAAIAYGITVATWISDLFGSSSLSMYVDRSMHNLSFIDLVFWFVAVFFAVVLAKRSLSRSERMAIGTFPPDKHR